MNKIKKNDVVMTIAGKDSGKTGRVLAVFPRESKILVEGINFIKKHARRTQKDQQGGIVQRELPVSISNVMLICKSCNRPTKVGLTVLQDKTKARVCKKCKEIIN